MTLGERMKLLIEFPTSDEEMDAEDNLEEDGDGDSAGKGEMTLFIALYYFH